MSNTNSGNMAGTLGFIFALLATFFFWLPYLGGIFWIIGAILSCVGLGGYPKWAAWSGFWLSTAWIICYFIFGFMFDSLVYMTVYPLYYW